jgi:signal transduction histidine kinase/CheY-like chemotaxis protein
MPANPTTARELESSVTTLQELLAAMERTVIEQSGRLEDALELAQRASHAKSEFLTTMSHEIRTPMNSVMGMADLLAETHLSSEQRHYLDIMVANGNTLLDLINSLLDLVRIESGHMQLEHTQFDLIDLIDRTMATFGVQAHSKGLELVARIAPEVPGCLLGDPLRLRQIIVNLVANAIKFTERGEVILEVEAIAQSAAHADLRFTVTDSGIGIPQEKLNSIFSTFTQGDSSISRKYGGSGLGLAIAKRLVDLMHGRIAVETEPGRGSKFSFTAPFELQSFQGSPDPPAILDLFGSRVLIVDANRVNRLLVREAIAHRGGEVVEACSRDEAMAAIRKAAAMNKPYKIVLFDMRMPDGGLELVKGIRREQLPIASLIPMLHSDDMRQQIAQFAEHRLKSYLVKPITRRELYNAIGNEFGAHHSISSHLERLSAGHILAQLPEGPPIRILVAEDSPDNRLLIEAYLHKEPCSVTVACDGGQAVQQAIANSFDLIFMDIQMPIMDGLAATRAIRKWESEHSRGPVTIIALSASALEDDVKQSLLAGCDSHISKPVKKRVILDAIREVALRRPSRAVHHAASPPPPLDPSTT